jgi:hypothetical protein
MLVPRARFYAFYCIKTNLVNEVVTAIRGSLDAHRRKIMKCIFVQLPTFEAVRRLDRDLFLSKKDDQQRIVAILLALRELGLIHFNSRDSETWFYFDPKENEADNVIVMKLKKSEMLAFD